ncbi:MAG: pyridoxamine 5'-phosphate oxidase family protein [Acidimicrobiales bacterium]|nr:pyridoxamine 5'-phosphate oxidase family protein [Acidimicrobiales bacterium]
MGTLDDLTAHAPAIAEFFHRKVAAAGLCFLGTVRADGSPRVSPLEVWVHEGGLYAGSMPGAVKARDLQRDPRCCLVTPLADKDDLAGEVKLFCQAREITDPVQWEGPRRAFEADRGFDMGEPGGANLFCFDVDAAAWQRVEGDDWRTTSWTADAGPRERTRAGGSEPPRDLRPPLLV